MYLALGIAWAVGFWLAVKRSSKYLYGRDVAGSLAHLPIYLPGGYAIIARAIWRWASDQGPYYAPPDPTTRREEP